MKLKQGFTDITYEDYMALPEYPDIMSYSGLKVFGRSPLHFKEAYKGRADEKTPDFICGDLVHERVLQGIDHVDMFKDGKKSKESTVWDKRKDDILASEAMIHAHESAHTILSLPDNEYERTGFLMHPEYRYWLTFRTDIINHRKAIIADLKTSADASPDKFSRDAANFKYHWQAAFYTWAANILTGKDYQFLWIVVEKKPPFAVVVYRAPEDMVISAWTAMEPLFEKYRDCLANNHWPAYDLTQDIIDLNLPRWAT